MKNSRRKFIRNISGLAVSPLLSFTPPPAENRMFLSRDSHRILSCNIRVALEEDELKEVGWTSRRDICLKIIASRKPDIIALQEVLKTQATDFSEHFSDHHLIGFEGPEMDAHPSGYHGIAKNPILYSIKRYELLAAGSYWLSETPLVAGSKSWDTARARHANWVRLKDKHSKKEIRVINLHLDHVSEKAKIAQAKLVVEESAQYQPDFPQILAGDFNARFTSEVFHSVRNNGWKEIFEELHGRREIGFTGHEFQGRNYQKASSKGRIDYVWFRGNLKAAAAEIIKEDIDGKYPSDHFFVQADLIAI